MKKMVLLLISICFVVNVNAKNYDNDGKPYDFYCYIDNIGYEIFWPGIKGYHPLYNQQGEKETFTNAADLLLYMSKRGWECINIECIEFSIIAGNEKRKFFIFKKKVISD